MKRLACLTFCALLCSAVGFCDITVSGVTLSGVTLDTDARPLIFCYGDSITTGYPTTAGYRDDLQALIGISNYNYVGVYSQTVSGADDDVNYSAKGGYTTAQIEELVTQDIAYGRYAYNVGGIALIHAGINDKYSSLTYEGAVQNIVDMVNLIDAANSDIDVYVALIIPDASDNQWQADFMGLLETTMQAMQASKPNLYIVDHYAAFKAANEDWATELLSDSAHPTDAGYAVMANTWHQAITDCDSYEYCE